VLSEFRGQTSCAKKTATPVATEFSPFIEHMVMNVMIQESKPDTSAPQLEALASRAGEHERRIDAEHERRH